MITGISEVSLTHTTDSDIQDIRGKVKARQYRFTIHAFERCVERKISPNEVEEVILLGEIIENYPKDKYGPSCLIYGITEQGRVIHVQCSVDPVWIITAYDPTSQPEEWEEDFKRRRA
jgi:hypothetical protein